MGRGGVGSGAGRGGVWGGQCLSGNILCQALNMFHCVCT